MSGPGLPGFSGKVTLESAGDKQILLTTDDHELVEYLKANGNSYVASFTPAGSAESGGSSEAPTS